MTKSTQSKQVQCHYKDVKKAIKKEKFANPFTLGKYSLSPYMACEYGCLYCDGRAERYYVQGDFAKDIVVRKNLPTLLEEELPKLREKGIIAIGSGITDPYQPTEGREKIVYEAARTIEKNAFPATVLTKSSLILRDLDIWKKVNEKTGFILLISLTFSNDHIRQIFEPRASSILERLNVIQKFKEKNIPVGVLAMPFLPHISDTRENIIALYENLNELGVDFIIPGGLTLRPGRQKELFLDLVQTRFPQYLDGIKQIYQANLSSGSPDATYYMDLFQKIGQITTGFDIPSVAPHRLYRNAMPKYDEVFILLNHMKDLYMNRGVDVSPLNRAINRYASWLKKEKAFYNRRRKIEDNYVDIKLEHQCRTGGLSTIIENEKLEAFLIDIIINRKIFDPLLMKLQSKIGPDMF